MGHRIWICCLLSSCFALSVLLACEEERPTDKGNSDAWTLRKLSGDGQSVIVHDTLTNRMVVELKDGLKKPIEDEQVRFEVVDGNGMVVSKLTSAASPSEVLMPTDWRGQAATTFQCFDTGTSVIEVKVVSRPELTVQFSITGVQP